MEKPSEARPRQPMTTNSPTISSPSPPTKSCPLKSP